MLLNILCYCVDWALQCLGVRVLSGFLVLIFLLRQTSVSIKFGLNFEFVAELKPSGGFF